MTLTQLLLLPAFLHVALVTAVAWRMGAARRAAVRGGRVSLGEIAVDGSRWPDDIRKLANSYQNQFELPMLFYAALALLLVTGLADGVSVLLAWAFVLARIVHAVVHTGGNVVIHRFYAFLAGFACLIVLWVWFGLRLFVIG